MLNPDRTVNTVSFLCCFAPGPVTEGWPCIVSDGLSAVGKGVDWWPCASPPGGTDACRAGASRQAGACPSRASCCSAVLQRKMLGASLKEIR